MPLWPSRNWYPSGAALATRAEPVIPPAPLTFSTMTCWPRTSDSRAETMRAAVSLPLPAANGTTIVTGWFGHCPAATDVLARTEAMKQIASRRRLIGSDTTAMVG